MYYFENNLQKVLYIANFTNKGSSKCKFDVLFNQHLNFFLPTLALTFVQLHCTFMEKKTKCANKSSKIVSTKTEHILLVKLILLEHFLSLGQP